MGQYRNWPGSFDHLVGACEQRERNAVRPAPGNMQQPWVPRSSPQVLGSSLARQTGDNFFLLSYCSHTVALHLVTSRLRWSDAERALK